MIRKSPKQKPSERICFVIPEHDVYFKLLDGYPIIVEHKGVRFRLQKLSRQVIG